METNSLSCRWPLFHVWLIADKIIVFGAMIILLKPELSELIDIK